MTKQDFIHYLSYPENLNSGSIASFEKLVQEYPYFQMGRMLYLKNLHNENNINYEKNLHITSAYAPSGKVLYNLIKKKPDQSQSITKVKAVEDMKTVEMETPSISYSLPDIVPKLEPIAILKEVPILVKEEKQDDELQLLEKQMLHEAYRVSMTVDLIEEVVGDKGQEAKEKGQEARYQKQEAGAERQGTGENPRSIIHHPSSIIHYSECFSFGDWMKVVGGNAPEAAKEEKAIQPKAKLNSINNFLLEQTAKPVPKQKAQFYSAEIMAKKSLQDDENFVTETLAGIYLSQGHLSKALRSYQILLVKHPEKTYIFAPLLEKIQKLLEGQKSK